MIDIAALSNWIEPEEKTHHLFRGESAREFVERIEPGKLAIGSRGDCDNKILCVERGQLKVEGPSGLWSILPAHMVFIPHDRPYRIYTSSDAVLTIIHLGVEHTAWQHEGCWVASMTSLAREMFSYALRWGRTRDGSDAVANAYLNTIGLLCKEWFECSRMMWVPYGDSPIIKRAVAYTRTRLDSATIELAAEAAGTSTRTLRRHFQEELGMSWRNFLKELRMTRAIELLTLKHMSVTQTALEVGFNSGAAFTLAFTAFTGKNPSVYARDFLNNGSIVR